MKLNSQFEYKGGVYMVEYEDCDDFSVLPDELCTQHYGVCFVGDQIIIGLHGAEKEKQHWKIIGGTREPGESTHNTLTREIVEEANMEVVESQPIGYQKVTDPDGKAAYHLRSWCRVKPLGEFVADPDQGVFELKYIDPSEYRKYCDWGEIGDRIMERAAEINQSKK